MIKEDIVLPKLRRHCVKGILVEDEYLRNKSLYRIVLYTDHIAHSYLAFDGKNIECLPAKVTLLWKKKT